VHPEVSFVHANGGAGLPRSKSSWNGIHLRRRILVSPGICLPEDLGVPERPALGMCVTLQSPPGLRIGLLAERRCREKVGMEIHPYFCPTFASRAANRSFLPSRGAAEKAQVEP